MKNLFLLLIISGCFVIFSCKEKDSERFSFLTGVTWVTDSLIANGQDASEPGQLLADFKGEAKFNKDGTGNFGNYTGTWNFSSSETQLVIKSEAIAVPIIADIKELTSVSLKLTTVLPNQQDLLNPHKIRMTFKAK
ncbi:MAG: hypothetical protein GYA41_06555 [Bacteroidales bacterium]|nr:hypothetical protein [Bacteroidales bacterium]